MKKKQYLVEYYHAGGKQLFAGVFQGINREEAMLEAVRIYGKIVIKSCTLC